MSTGFVFPDAEVPDGVLRSVIRTDEQVAFIDVTIIGAARYTTQTDSRVALIRRFIDAHAWKANVVNDYHNYVTRRSASKMLGKARANGLLERSGCVLIVWPWEQVFQWLRNGWPGTGGLPIDGPLGTWVSAEDGSVELSKCQHSGWPNAKKQLRSIGIPSDVYNLKRRMTETEEIDALCRVLKTHKKSLDKLYN